MKSPLAGQPAQAAPLVDIDKLIKAYYSQYPDPAVVGQRVSFGTSGHRGSSLLTSFNEAHVWAISQAICQYRKGQGIDGPLFLGIDTHALSLPAFRSALEVLAANQVEVRIALGDEPTPTPTVSHAILVYNRGRKTGLADGIVVTPSHNPPDSGGFKYNPPSGGPADTSITGWIESAANAFLAARMEGVQRLSYENARRASTTKEHDFLTAYVDDLGSVIDFAAIQASTIRMGVDPLGGAGVHYWARIAERYKLNLTVVSDVIDPTFSFMSLDWDGRIRMDPSSADAMQRLIGLAQQYDIAFACDTDHDRHGIVTPSAGLMPPNHYLAVAIDYLYRNRPLWEKAAAVGKTAVSSALIDRVAARLGRKLYEVPVGFKWFVDGLLSGGLGFGGEESAGASFLRRDGAVWTTDKDGIAAALLSAEITARSGRDPGVLYRELTAALGDPAADRLEAPANAVQRQKLGKLSAQQVQLKDLCGEPVLWVLDRAPGNNAPLGGIKVVAKSSWFAARPSGTEDIYKIYGESFLGQDSLHKLLQEAQSIVDHVLVDP